MQLCFATIPRFASIPVRYTFSINMRLSLTTKQFWKDLHFHHFKKFAGFVEKKCSNSRSYKWSKSWRLLKQLFCEDYISFLCYNITYFTVLCVHFGSNKWAPCCCFEYSNALSILSFQPSRKTKLEKRMPWTFFICSRSFCGGRKFEKTFFVEWRLFARLLFGSTDPFSLIQTFAVNLVN